MSEEIHINNDIFRKKLVRLVLSIAFQQFMLAIVSASDALMLGKVEQESLAAVSLAGQVTFVQNLFLGAMTIGTSMFAAQYWGKGDRRSVEKVFAYVLKVTAIVSALFFAAGLAIPELLMKIFTNEPVLIERGAQYLRVVALSYLLSGISQIYLCVLKNSEKAVKATTISSVVVVLNVLLNALLIFGLCGLPRMEIAGAALATVLAKVVELIWCIVESMRKDGIRFRLSFALKSDSLLRKDFWKYTAPAMGNQIIWGCGYTMYSVIMGHMGTDAVAANSIANVVKSLMACFCGGLGSGGGILIGNELGAGKLERAKVYGDRLCRCAVWIGVISGGVLLALIPLILKVTDLTPQAHHYLKWMLLMCTYYLVGKAITATNIGGIFCAGGDSRFGLVCDTITMWCVTVPIGLISAFVLKLPVLAVYMLINIDEIIKLPAVFANYKKYRWVKDLTRKEE